MKLIKRFKRIGRSILTNKYFYSVAKKIGLSWIESLKLDPQFLEDFFQTLNQAQKNNKKYGMVAFFHEDVVSMLLVMKYMKHLDHVTVVVIASPSEIGNVIDEVTQHFGFEVVRASTKRGYIQLMKRIRNHEISETKSNYTFIGFAVDGSKGPRRYLKPGITSSASLLQSDLWFFRFISKGIRLKSWDRMMIPLPFSIIKAKFIHYDYDSFSQSGTNSEHLRAKAEACLKELHLD